MESVTLYDIFSVQDHDPRYTMNWGRDLDIAIIRPIIFLYYYPVYNTNRYNCRMTYFHRIYPSLIYMHRLFQRTL